MQGILFKPDMIKAIVDLRKTVTRRAMNPQPECKCEGNHWEGQVIDWVGDKLEGKTGFFCQKCGSGLVLADAWSGRGRLPRYQVGETVYIKEAWQSLGNKENTVYKLDGESKLVWDINGKHGEEVVKKWRSPLFMPAWAARYFLKITDVSAGRVQEITWKDCQMEGIKYLIYPNESRTYEGEYERLWDSINGDGDFALNKWVWRYEFEVIK